MVKALIEANENAELEAEKYKQKESSFIIEKDHLLREISSLKMLLDAKELNYQDMEKKFESSLAKANEVASELEIGIRHLKNFLSENFESVSSDVEWMKSKFHQFEDLAKTWLEDIWLEVDATNMKHNEKISVLEKQLANANRELGTVSTKNSELRSQLNHNERLSNSMKEELTHKSNATEKMEERLCELRNLLDERSSFLQNLQNDFSKLSGEKQCCDSQVLILREKLERAQAVAEESEAIAAEARQVLSYLLHYFSLPWYRLRLFSWITLLLYLCR
jgi:kinesin family protein 15